MSSSSSEEITVTLVNASTGQSESIGVHATRTTLQDLMEWSKALFGLDDENGNGGRLQLRKDGAILSTLSNATSLSLQQAGIRHGDVVAVVEQQQQQARQQQPPPSQQRPAPPQAGNSSTGGLDFSSLLEHNHDAATVATAPAPANASSSSASPPPVVVSYYPGMSLDECMTHNTHPRSLVTLLLRHEHLMKELNYHSPQLAQEIRRQPTLDESVKVFRNHMVKAGIQSALQSTQNYHTEKTMRERLSRDPNDIEAKQYFQKQESQELIRLQYQQMMEEYPESMGRVLMLYIHARVNGRDIHAFVDSGAQQTIMSKKCAQDCGVLHLVDTRFAGVAVGVGKGKVLGRIHIVHLQIIIQKEEYHFPCSVTVMDDEGLGDQNMDFLLGLDMLKRHTCRIDLERGVLTFRLSDQKYMETPFLHEKDLEESKGGTKGFDADRANQKLLEELNKKQHGSGDDDGGGGGADKDGRDSDHQPPMDTSS